MPHTTWLKLLATNGRRLQTVEDMPGGTWGSGCQPGPPFAIPRAPYLRALPPCLSRLQRRVQGAQGGAQPGAVEGGGAGDPRHPPASRGVVRGHPAHARALSAARAWHVRWVLWHVGRATTRSRRNLGSPADCRLLLYLLSCSVCYLCLIYTHLHGVKPPPAVPPDCSRCHMNAGLQACTRLSPHPYCYPPVHMQAQPLSLAPASSQVSNPAGYCCTRRFWWHSSSRIE